MKTTMKRIFSLLIVLVMVCGMLPVVASAADGTWTLVKDASTLAVGDQIIIVAKNANYALSTTQNTNNRGQAAVTKSGDTVTFNSGVQVLTLEAGTKTGTFAFYTGSGYLYTSSSSKNYLKTQTTKNDYGSWTITIASTGVATIKAQGGNTRNWLRYNSSDKLFACYSSGQADVAIYKLVVAGGEEEEHVHAYTDGKCTCGYYEPKTLLSIVDANAFGLTYASDNYSPDEYYVEGIVSKVSNTEYGNMYIKDAQGNEFYIYGTKNADGTAQYTSMVAGDYVKVYGSIGQHNGTAQIKDGWLVAHCNHKDAEGNSLCAVEETVEATCTTDGEKKYTCSECGHIYFEVVDATGHNYVDGVCENCNEEQYSISFFVNGTVTEKIPYVSGGIEMPAGNDSGSYTFIGWTDAAIVEEITIAPGTVYAAGQVVEFDAETTLHALYTRTEGSTATEYEKKALADIDTADQFVIVGTKGTASYAMTNANGTDKAPSVVAVTAVDDTLTATPEDNILWTLSKDGENYIFHPNGDTSKWLYCTNDNNGVRVGTNAAKTFVLDASGYLKNVTRGRYLGIYNNQDWRCYTSSTTANIANQTFTFYAKAGATIHYTTSIECEHTYEGSESKAATCTEAGEMTYTCSKCGHSYKEAISALGHKYESEVNIAAGCETEGEMTYTCSVCDHSYEAVIPANGHTWANGLCSVCNAKTTVYTLVTDVNNLVVGDTIIIVAAESEYALSTEQKSNNRGQVAIIKGVDGIVPGDDVQIITLEAGTVDGTFAFNVGTAGYLYAADSDENYLKTQTTNNDNGSWTIEVTDEGVATIKAKGTNTHNWLRYNSSSKLFSCYASGQKDVAIYQATIYGGQPVCRHQWNEGEVTTPAGCETEGVKTYTCSLCGATSTEEIPATGHDFANGDCACGEADPIKTIPDANTLGAACEHDNFTSEKYTVVGTVKEIANAQYGNMYIEDAEGNTLFIYGLYSADGNTRFDAMEVKPAVGDQIKVYGVLGNYNGAQMKDAWLLKIADYVDSYNVVLTDKIGMNFKLSANVTSATVTFGGETTTVALDSLPTDENGLRIYSLKMAAAQMADEVVWLFNGKTEATYSVRGYADVVLSGEYGVNEKAMVRAMLHYGAAAQDYFNYNDGDYANAGMTDTVTNPIQAAEMVPTTGETAGIVHYGSTLVYRDRVAVRVYFKLTGDAAIDAFTFTANGEAVEAQEGSNGLYYVEIADIAPQNLDDAVTVTVNDGLTVTYSALNYITRMVNKTEDNVLKTLLQQLYDYYMAAEYLVENGPDDFETEPDVVG